MGAMSQAIPARTPITALAFSLSAFLAITYLLCVAAAWIASSLDGHALLQFVPRFAWNAQGIHRGLIASLAYGFYVAIVFGVLFDFFAELTSQMSRDEREQERKAQ